MKKNGFTLAEILGVVILLGALMLFVATPIVNNVYSKKNDLDKVNIELITSATEKYLENNKSGYKPYDGISYKVTIKQLIESKLLDKNILTNKLTKIIEETDYIKINGNGKNFNISNNLYKNEGIISLLKNKSTVTFNSNKYLDSNEDNITIHFSGMDWIVIGYNKDGSVRLLLKENITALIPNDGTSTYEDSYIRKWLNEEFYSKIIRNDLIVPGNFCTDTSPNTSKTKSICTNIVNDKVGMLSLYEINKGLNKDLINNNTPYALITLNNNENYIFNNDNSILTTDNTRPLYIRPVINIYGSVWFDKQTSIDNNPYLINEEYLSNVENRVFEPGKYIKFKSNDNVFRIMESTTEYIKLISNSTFINTKYSSFSNNLNIQEGLGYKLNKELYYNLGFSKDVYNNILNNMIYNASFDYDYKTYQNDKFLVENAYLGIPKLGDMFLHPNTSFVTSTSTDLDSIYYIDNPIITKRNKNENLNSKIVFYVKNNFRVNSGDGITPDTSYILEST